MKNKNKSNRRKNKLSPVFRGDVASSIEEVLELYHITMHDSAKCIALDGSHSRARVNRYRLLYWAFFRSLSGEEQGAFGLWERDGKLWMTTGSECSVWDFNGQFIPEEVTAEHLRHFFSEGTYGLGFSSGRVSGVSRSDLEADLYRTDFLEWLDQYTKEQELTGRFKEGISVNYSR